MRAFDAVLFDAGETLVHPHPSFPELIGALLRDRGVDVGGDGYDMLETALRRAFASLASSGEVFSISREASIRFWNAIYGSVLADIGVDDADGAIADYLYEEFTKPERYELFPDSMPALRELAAEGYRLGVVSNWEAWLPTLLERLGVLPLLEVCVVSGVEGFEKPDPRLFRLALERIGVPPDRAVYVGDSPVFDVEPALALGMGAVLIDRRGRYPEAPSVSSLLEVPALVRNGAGRLRSSQGAPR